MKQTPTVYTFGYWGWGTNTERLVKLAAEWEEKAGRHEPLWVDIRWSRSVPPCTVAAHNAAPQPTELLRTGRQTRH